MKVVVDRKDMENGIVTAAKAVNPKSPLPILSHILVRAEGDMLRFSATDLEMVVECQVRAHVLEPGAFTAPARLLQEIVTQLPEAEVSLALAGPQIELRTRSSEFKINTLSAEEFPVLPEAEGAPTLVLPQELFREMVRGVLFAVAPSEETRVILTGVFTQIDGERATFVAAPAPKNMVNTAATPATRTMAIPVACCGPTLASSISRNCKVPDPAETPCAAVSGGLAAAKTCE